MKIKNQNLIIMAATAFLPLTAFAQSPPAPPAPPAPGAPAVAPVPPMPPGPGRHREHEDRGPKVPVTWLGLETSEVPGVLCDQLGLPKGFGLVVDYVVPEGPAAAAGVQPNDILKMYNDQILVDPGQLSKLVRSGTEGTSVNLTVLRKGQEQKFSVKLSKRDVPKRNAMNGFNFNFGDMDMGDLRDQLGTMKMNLKEGLKGLKDGAAHDAMMQARDEILKAREQVREATADARRNSGRTINIVRTDDGGVKTTKLDMNKAQITFSDDKGEIRIDQDNGKKIVTAKDAQGRLLYSGPAETKEDLDKMPPEVRDRYNGLQQNELPKITSKQIESDEDANDDDEDSDADDDSDDSSGTSGVSLEETGPSYPVADDWVRI
ncbi:MAG: PDZ domain-containing protein [Verrucomicrobiota bacterium]